VRSRPEYEASLRVLDAATLLTFRDYLHNPDGAAYGIKQKLGQFNLVGKLPVRNAYAAGQSAVLPGLVGAMMSSFVIARVIVGKADYDRFLSRRLAQLREPE
jgi:phytoene dehydrogenase-like protein